MCQKNQSLTSQDAPWFRQQLIFSHLPSEITGSEKLQKTTKSKVPGLRHFRKTSSSTSQLANPELSEKPNLRTQLQNLTLKLAKATSIIMLLLKLTIKRYASISG